VLYLDDRNLRLYSYSSASSHLPFLFLSSSPSPPPLFLFLSSAPLRGASTRCIPGASPRNLRCTQCFSPVPKTPVSPVCLSAMSSLPLLVASLSNVYSQCISRIIFPSAFPQPPAFSSASSVCVHSASPQCLFSLSFLGVWSLCSLPLLGASLPSFSSVSLVSVFSVLRAPPKCLSPLLIGHIVSPSYPQYLVSMSSIPLLPYVSSWPLPILSASPQFVSSKSFLNVFRRYPQRLSSMSFMFPKLLGASTGIEGFQSALTTGTEDRP
jgi:hypothetical protein